MKRFTIILIVVVVIASITSSGSEPTVKFNQMMLYSESVSNYAPELPNIYNSTQNRINRIVYGQSAIIFSRDHVEVCYGDVNTPAFNSFKEHITPLTPLAFSVVEWGGNGDLKYSFTPAIATRKLAEANVPMSIVDPVTIGAEYYESMGVRFSDKSYWGPLQVNKNYLTPNHNKGYKCGYVPTDYYNWADVCQWTFHDKCEQIKNTWNKNYVFNNEYAVVAHTSIAHNSGGSHLSSQNFQLNKDWYPWKSSTAVFSYVNYITGDSALNIILSDADEYSKTLIDEYESGNIHGTLYKSVGECRNLSRKLNINWSNYVKDEWLPNMNGNDSLEGSALRNWEKTMYPIQAIWSYRVLENLYGLK